MSVSIFLYWLNTKFYYCQQYTSSQVNLKSCCVVPEELSNFAKSNKLTLLTHSDPGELLPGDCLRNMLYPKLAREAGHYAADWVARYNLQISLYLLIITFPNHNHLIKNLCYIILRFHHKGLHFKKVKIETILDTRCI